MENKIKNFDYLLEQINNCCDNINKNNDNDYQNYIVIKDFVENLDYYKKKFEDLQISGNMVLDIQEKERQRIARDLHDSSLQNLTHLIHKLELTAKYMETDSIQAKLELALVKNDLKAIIQEIRNTIFDLRPMTFDDLGFKQSIKRLIDNFKVIYNNDIILNMEEVTSNSSLVLITVYRIINECLSNAVYHSNSKKIEITIYEKDSSLFVFINDDGIGFDYEKMKSKKDVHFGLKIMEERILLLNGIFNVESNNTGTCINIEIPKFKDRGELV